MNVKKVFLWSFGLLFTLGILGCAAVAGLFYWASRDLPDLERLTGYEAPQATVILARDGSTIGTLATEKRYSITLKEMSPWLPMSFLAAEDDSFYQHHGVDPVAIVRAFIYNLRNKASGGGQQGGSTITQQIIKQLLLSSERSYTRKMKEAILAYRLEHTVSKDDILQTYLNYIYLGQHSYGVEAAARTYFGKHASDITLAESAVIAGLPQAPSRYNPFRHPEAAKAFLDFCAGPAVGKIAADFSGIAARKGFSTPEGEKIAASFLAMDFARAAADKEGILKRWHAMASR